MNLRAHKPTPLLLTCFATLWFSSFTLYAQNEPLKYERFTSEQGLSSNIVYCLFQDSKGFLWIGTNDGLNRYDGYHFKTWRNNPSDSNSLPANVVNSICEDASGNIWVGTLHGLCKFNPATNNFTPIKTRIEEGPKEVRQIVRVNHDELLIAYTSGTKLLNVRSKEMSAITDEQNKSMMYTMNRPFSTDKQGTIYATSHFYSDTILHDAIYVYDEKNKRFKRYITTVTKKLRDNNIYHCYLKDSRGLEWMGTGNSGYFIQYSSPGMGKEELKYLLTDKVSVNSIHEDNEGRLWIATHKGLFIYDYTAGQFNPPLYARLVQELNNVEVLHTLQDRSGVVWIATFNGLYKFNPAISKFSHFTAGKTSRPRLLHNTLVGINPAAENSVLLRYIWQEPAYSVMDLSSKKIMHHNPADFKLNYLPYVMLKNKKYFNADTLKKWLPVIQEQVNKKYPGLSLIKAWFWFVFDKNESMWGVSSQGNYIQKFGQSRYHSYHPGMNDIAVSGDDCWFTSNDGLLQFDFKTESFKIYAADPQDSHSLSTNELTCLLLEKEGGNIWIGTKGNGLDYFDRQKNIFLHYTTNNGLPHNSIYNMLFDDAGRLWLGTGNGLSCLDTATKTFRNFFRTDGLINSEYNRQSACKLSNGYLLMGGMDGIDYFHPDSVLGNGLKPPVQITDFRVFNKTIHDWRNIRLPHNENYVNIDFAALDFRNTEANKYAYKLEGIDRGWNYTEQNSISYATLLPGRYHFLVRGVGSDGTWSDEPAEIYFTILTPWWRTSWFLSLAVIFIIAVLYSLYRFRVQQLKKVVEIRTKIARDLHDEMGASLSGIKVFSQLAKERPQYNQEYMDQISRYSDQTIEKLKEIVWAMNTDNGNFKIIIADLLSYAETMTSAKGIGLEFYADPVLLKKQQSIRLSKNIYMIIREGVNNAIKYSGCSMLKIALRATASGMQLIISDNGKGFDTTMINRGNGLSNMKKRAEEINGSFAIETAPEKGSRITLDIKFT
jgi:signal transduction histidine kinase/ligand-binding sensor domain-containing protein